MDWQRQRRREWEAGDQELAVEEDLARTSRGRRVGQDQWDQKPKILLI